MQTFLSYLPSNDWQAPPIIESKDDPNRRVERLISIIPKHRRSPYKIRDISNIICYKFNFVKGNYYGWRYNNRELRS
ncbi:carboxyl transferase domain-containing protein [Alkalihalobacterium elongatum]|uniref:carboxyl transferase domain-containing protein n=1 Tax=Alkalihalobacterium elongatum TaxID=2675466 RepID=UPI001C1FE0DA